MSIRSWLGDLVREVGIDNQVGIDKTVTIIITNTNNTNNTNNTHNFHR